MTQPRSPAPTPMITTSPRYGMQLPERADRVLVDVLRDAYLTLDRDSAHLHLDNTFTETIRIDKSLSVGTTGWFGSTLEAAAYDVTSIASEAGAPDYVFGLMSGEKRFKIWPRLAVAPPPPVGYWTWNGTELVPTGGQNVGANQLRSSGYVISGSWIRSAIGFTFHSNDGIWINWDGASIIHSHQVRAPSIYSDAHIQSVGRLITNNWDSGWANSMGGDLIASGAVHSRGGHRCWDAADFTYNVSNAGYQLVQRGGSGEIYVGQMHAAGRLITNNSDWGWSNNLGGDTICGGKIQAHGVQTDASGAGFSFGAGNAGLWPGVNIGRDWDTVYVTYHLYAFSSIANGGWMDVGLGLRVREQISAANSYNGYANGNAFLTPNVGGQWGEGLAREWRTFSCVDHAFEFGLRADPIPNALATVKAITGYTYDHTQTHPYGQIMRTKSGDVATVPELGFRATEVAQHFPELVGNNPFTGTPEYLDFGRLVPVLWEAVKELSAQVEALQAAAA